MKKMLVGEKITLILCCITMLFSTALADAKDGIRSGDWSYSLLESGDAKLVGWYGADANVVIPAEIDGHRLTELGAFAFENCASLTSVVIPESVIKLGTGVFAGCKNLTDVKLPSGLTELGDSAFKNCVSVVKIDIPDGISSIGSETFRGCNGLADVELPDNLKQICESAFSSTALTSVVIPEGVISIGSHAYSYCPSLTSVTIPDSVENSWYRNANCFAGCPSLTTIIVSPANPLRMTIDGVLFLRDPQTLITYPMGSPATSYTVPEGTVNITSSAFRGAANLTEVVLPEGLTELEAVGFDDCPKLTRVTLPASITSIEDRVFGYSAPYGRADQITLVVTRDSYAEKFAKLRNLKYEYAGE